MNIFSRYYHRDLINFFRQVVPKGHSAISVYDQRVSGTYDYLLLPNSLTYTKDVQYFIKRLTKNCHYKTRIVVVYFNFLWKPALALATFLSLRKKDPREPNWISSNDLSSLFHLEGFEEIKRGRRLLLPVEIPFLSTAINRFVAQLPLVNAFCLTTYQIFRPVTKPKRFSVSVIIPARNEEGNIKGILGKIPQMGTKTEIIFVEGNSQDNTYLAIKEEIEKNKRIGLSVRLYKQKGRGKADAVRLGFKRAKNDILMILDADLTVNPKDLPKFYRVLAKGYADFANGSRLVYPMEKQAMRTLNHIGNKLFGLAFTFLLGQPLRDTLCGTKALFREDYLRIVKGRKLLGYFDPFGDFDLLFGATKLNLKILDVPIRYGERLYGTTNISRFKHGLLLLKMTLFAAKKIKFI